MSVRPRSLVVDAIKAGAAQIIVLHHLAWYGPMSDVAAGLAAPVADALAGLANHGRYAVAAFIVVAGYLAAAGLRAEGFQTGVRPHALIWRRYLRLVGPFAVALVLAMLAGVWARAWMDHPSVGAPPEIGQFLAHLLLLHGPLGYESLSAGAWYVAIDFQLYALLVLLSWIAARFGRRPAGADFATVAFALPLALASLLYFNRDARWDDTALYFFGLYALGAGVAWAERNGRSLRLLGLFLLAGACALALDFRPRLAVGLGIALLLWVSWSPRRTESAWLARCGDASYALFLVHFPVCLVVNAAMQRIAPDDAALNLAGIGAAWLASNLVAFGFRAFVEKPLLSLAGRN